MIGTLISVVLAMSAIVCQVAWASGWSQPRSWETRVLGVKVTGEVQRNINDIKGVLYIYEPFGKRITYHFKGRVEGDTVTASHTDGHVFRGKITQDRKVEGILTTVKGHRIPVKAPIP